MKRRYTFFDFDGTLTRRDTFTGMIRFVCGTGGFLWSLLRAAPAIISWLTGRSNNSDAKQRLFGIAFGGMEADDFRNACTAYSRSVDRMVRPEIVRALHEAAARGDTVAVVSASIADWIRPWARRHGVETVLATEAGIGDANRLSGRFSSRNCHGPEKVARILEAFPELKTAREEAYVTAYGDSPGDRELLAFADSPHLTGH